MFFTAKLLLTYSSVVLKPNIPFVNIFIIPISKKNDFHNWKNMVVKTNKV
jgi:hypothetical protein